MRVPDFAVRSVADLGAGAGNVSKLLKERWPDAVVTGVEGSAEMVAAGKKAAPDIQWQQQDLASWQPAQAYDLIYSNAALHWLPDHAALFPALMQKVAPGGILAVQMPRNFLAPSHLLIGETALNGPWRSKVEHLVTPPPVAEPGFYHALLAPLSENIDIWETEYLQVLEGDNPVKEWTKGTWLTRYLDILQGAREGRVRGGLWRAGGEGLPEERRRPDAFSLPPSVHGGAAQALRPATCCLSTRQGRARKT